MTVLLQDAFNRTASDLSASPSGRWAVPSPGGGLTNAFSLDGQITRTATTTTASTTLLAFFYGTNPGTARGEWRCRGQRATSNVRAIGVVARASTGSALLYERYWFGVTNETGTERFELRVYTAYSTYLLLTSANLSASSLTMDTNWHDFKLRITSSGTLLNFECRYDSTLALVLNNQPDLLVLGTYRGVGIQATSGATWTAATDYAAFDNAEFDNLSTPIVEADFAMVSEPTLSPITVTTETDSSTGSTLPTLPDWGEVLDESFETAEHPMDAGYVASFPTKTVSRKTYRVGWGPMNATDFDALRDFLIDTTNGVTSFTYTDPVGDAVTVRFVESSLTWAQVAPDVYEGVSATLREVG